MTSVKTSGANFLSALSDYKWMLERKYPQKAILKLIGDRYRLSGIERSMLYRGVCTSETCRMRKSKKFSRKPGSRTCLHLDAYNVLLTIGSYLNGNTVFIAMDGFLRDASEIHGKAFRKELLDRSLQLLLKYFQYCNVKTLFFYLDRPVSQSGATSVKINSLLNEMGFKGNASVHDSVDYALKQIDNGICATSDSAIIDNSRIPVFDAARKTIEFHFSPRFIDLEKLTRSSEFK